MVRKFRLCILLIVCAISAASLIAGCSKMCVNSKELKVTNSKNRIRLEHVAINVEDPASMAEWYCQNLGMKVVREGPAPVNMRFISDAGENMTLEIYRNPPDAVPDYASMDPLLLHIAFMADDVKDIRDKLIAAGATPVGDISVTPSGDEIAILRDPWGVAIQFVKRTEPMLPAE
ncbi:MAG: VOC family protein [Planctomycetota bacterium]